MRPGRALFPPFDRFTKPRFFRWIQLAQSVRLCVPPCERASSSSSLLVFLQVQVSVEEAVAALDGDDQRWEFIVAEERPRAVAGSGVDAVIRARRLT